MKKIYYEKVGRKYVPVAEYDNDYMDSFPKGHHLVSCVPGGQSRRFKIEPALAPMIAAGLFAEDAICKALNEASKLKPNRTPITAGQQKAWRKLAKEFGDELCTLQGLSAWEVANAGVKAMQDEAGKMMQHPMVKAAYDEFLSTYKLVAEQEGK